MYKEYPNYVVKYPNYVVKYPNKDVYQIWERLSKYNGETRERQGRDKGWLEKGFHFCEICQTPILKECRAFNFSPTPVYTNPRFLP